MSCDPGSFDSREGASDNSRFSAPCCNMCSRQEESKSYCTNCKSYLCDRCDFTHKLTVRYNFHSIISIEEVDSLENLEQVLNTEELRPEDDDNYVKRRLAHQIREGTQEANSLIKLSLDMKTTMQNLTRRRFEIIDNINDFYSSLLQQLKTEKDKLVTTVEEEFYVAHHNLREKQEECDSELSILLLRLSNLKLILGQNGESSNGSDELRLVPEGFANSFGYSASATSRSWGFDLYSAPNYYPLSVLNISLNEQVVEETALVNLNNHVYPYDSFNIPVVESEPSNYDCLANLDLSLSTTDPDSDPNTNCIRSMKINNTFGQKGNGPGQFNSPHGFCVGLDEDIVVADTGNHRVQIFDKTGFFKSQFGIAGRHDGYLWHPRKIAALPSRRCYVVCDRGYERSRMQIFTETGKFVKKIYIQYIDIVAAVAVAANEDIVVVNSATPTLFIIGQRNDYLRSIDCTPFMEEPSDLAVIGNEFYICDFKAHTVVVINQQGNLLRKIGTKNTTIYPNGIDLSLTDNIIVCDSHGNYFHAVIYTKNGEFVAEYRCPYVKVSRCCGLRVLPDGRLATVDKNYHHVIVFESLMFQ